MRNRQTYGPAETPGVGKPLQACFQDESKDRHRTIYTLRSLFLGGKILTVDNVLN